jgi:hypothetical protein
MSSLEWYLAKDCSTTTCNPQHQDFLLRIPVKLKNIYYYLLKVKYYKQSGKLLHRHLLDINKILRQNFRLGGGIRWRSTFWEDD